MSSQEPSFWKYITYDEFGMMNGISENAPDAEKEAYEKYLEEENADNFKIWHISGIAKYCPICYNETVIHNL